jgi:hypothetical protein
VLRWDPESGTEEAVTRVKLEEIEVSTTAVPNRQRARVRRKPMMPCDDWAVAWDGWVGIVRSVDYHVEWIGPEGQVVRGPKVEYDAVRVGSAEKESWLEEQDRNRLRIGVEDNSGVISTTFRRGSRRRGDFAVDAHEWPELMPAFQVGAVYATPSGTLWVQRSVAAGTPATFDVFDRRAKRVKQIVLPIRRQLVGFGKQAVYLVKVDELDLHWLERYQIDT